MWHKQAKTDNLLALPELLLAANPPPKPHQRFKVLARHLRNSDTLHQALLRAQRSLVRDFASPFAQTQDFMPGFSVFDLESGLAKSAFTRRDFDQREAVHPILKRIDFKPKSDMFKRDFHAIKLLLLVVLLLPASIHGRALFVSYTPAKHYTVVFLALS
ncbi:hypothetical protein BCR33DRAFT_716654 [Rhizoclosmatium globosum]|uniref:Uncharacterized protein n=1 Tax=Rhizoclosmatium globosum TaxID=329046 RepID=A0A1Y2CCA7_9FUNG|nr:hypothetical protein BCR33DRAFT_716654 [Rhizoclosmatium globosum]|eukprot:ORY44668.1 hypothetical protein BCR33DRAFT_716654 [Rhizoclosmatium globosum]